MLRKVAPEAGKAEERGQQCQQTGWEGGCTRGSSLQPAEVSLDSRHYSKSTELPEKKKYVSISIQYYYYF